MKRIISMMIICLLLVACSEPNNNKTEKKKELTNEIIYQYIDLIEINENNWNEYIELVEHEEEKVDNIDDFVSKTVDVCLKFKDESYGVLHRPSFTFTYDYNEIKNFKDLVTSEKSEMIDKNLKGRTKTEAYPGSLVCVYMKYATTKDQYGIYERTYEVSNLECKEVSGYIYRNNIPEEYKHYDEGGNSYYIIDGKTKYIAKFNWYLCELYNIEVRV